MLSIFSIVKKILSFFELITIILMFAERQCSLKNECSVTIKYMMYMKQTVSSFVCVLRNYNDLLFGRQVINKVV